MKPERGAVRLLLLAELVLLVAVIVIGIVEAFYTPKAGQESRSSSMEALPKETEQSEIEAEEHRIDSEAAEVSTESIQEFSAEVEEKLAAMTLEEKVAQMFLTTPESLTQSEQVNIAGAGTRNAIDRYPVGGLIYSDINYQGREQVRNLMFNAEEMSNDRIGLYLFLAVRMDDETGMSMVGIADSHEPDALVEILAAGRIGADSDGISLPMVFPTQQADITPDTAWVVLEAGTDAELTGDENLPCALSKRCVETVREMGYQGVILTDNLSAESIKGAYSVGEAAVLAIQAGVDMVYCPENFPDAYEAVLEAVQAGEITETQINEAVGHILNRKY